jgi:hypothetical protein
MFRKLVLLTALVTMSAAGSARADTFYGGSGLRHGRPANPSISLTSKDDGRVLGRIAYAYRCHGHFRSTIITRLGGRLNGQRFTATGSTRFRGVGRLRWRLTGTLTGDAGSGSARLRIAHACGGYTNTFVVRAAAAPAGAAAMPARGSTYYGVTAQSASGTRLPMTLRVATNGRVYAIWSAAMDCHRGTIATLNVSPSAKIKADGSFTRNERYTIRYTDGYFERYRVTFGGRFLADDVVGTLRMRMQGHQKGARFYPCDSGIHTWEARA